MSRIIAVTPVKNLTTEQKGELRIIAQKNTDFYGLSFFFEHETTREKQYICSFLLNEGEAKAFMQGYATSMRDLGHFLTVQNSYLEIIHVLGTNNKESLKSSPLFHKESVERATFELDVHDFQWSEGRLIDEYNENNELCGIRLAVIEALKNAESVTGTPIHYVYPKCSSLKVKDYYIKPLS